MSCFEQRLVTRYALSLLNDLLFSFLITEALSSSSVVVFLADYLGDWPRKSSQLQPL